MLIQVRFPPSDGSPSPYDALHPSLVKLGSSEVALIELQGELDVTGEKDGCVIGSLSLETPERPRLTIGHHILEGKIQNLPKSLAVLSKIESPAAELAHEPHNSSPANPELPPTPSSLEQGDESTASYDVVAIVKKKIVFSKRPVPIVGKGPVV